MRGMCKQSWPSECLLVLTSSWSLNSVKWEFKVTWLLTRKRSRQIVYKLLIGIPEKKKVEWRYNKLKFTTYFLSKYRESYLPSSSGWASWYSARTLNTLWALGVKLCNTIAAVLALWVVLPCARIRGKNIPSTLYGAKVGTWYQHQLNCVWTIFLSHTVNQIRKGN